jgi:hypothetical protein
VETHTHGSRADDDGTGGEGRRPEPAVGRAGREAATMGIHMKFDDSSWLDPLGLNGGAGVEHLGR